MGNVAHTPGPWAARKLGPPSYTWQVDSGGGPIAVITTPQPPFATKGDPARSEANARLIAAAPELLAVARGFVAIYGREGAYVSPLTNTCLRDARAAIAKATGNA
jgi:hypothetical protein